MNVMGKQRMCSILHIYYATENNYALNQERALASQIWNTHLWSSDWSPSFTNEDKVQAARLGGPPKVICQMAKME